MTEQPLVVVQARAGSTRLPGKVLAPIGDRPMLGLMLARLAPLADRAHLVVATTVHDRDDPVAAVAAEAGWAVVRGDEDDVLGRFLEALGRHRADDVVRLTADCPLIDPAVVAAALDLHRRTGADYTSNT
ncbi:MAG: NTP transferase domain-containing protein, partial [Acidimicrobiales bacterium]|nr:NTP transferase domain-containing protein [Acidimicrobiales bacterium]